MSLHLRKRGRSTRTLVRIAYSKFFACENCMKDQASEYIDELLERPRMTSAERRRLEANLFCPNCEAHLDPHYDQVVSHTDEELRVLRRRTLWSKRYGHRFKRFHEFLTKHPSLGAAHPIGKRLAQAVRQAPTINLAPKTWYRARNPIKNRRLTVADFLPPDPRKVSISPGRFNHAGQSAFYVADSAKTAAVEKLGKQEAQIWIAEVTITRPIRILDVRTMRLLEDDPSFPLVLAGLVYEGVVSRPTAGDLSYPQYHIPRYIADLVRLRKLDGIIYTSSKEYPFRPDVFGTNLVIVRPGLQEIIRTKEPRLFRWTESKIFWLPEMRPEEIKE